MAELAALKAAVRRYKNEGGTAVGVAQAINAQGAFSSQQEKLDIVHEVLNRRVFEGAYATKDPDAQRVRREWLMRSIRVAVCGHDDRGAADPGDAAAVSDASVAADALGDAMMQAAGNAAYAVHGPDAPVNTAEDHVSVEV